MRTFPIRWALLLAAGVVASRAWCGVPDLVRSLSSENGQTRLEALESIAPGQYGADAIAPVAALLDSGTPAIAGDARVALERIAGPLSGDAAGRADASRALCAAAEAAKGPVARRWLLWLVSYTGGTESVPSLTAMLDKAETFDMALFALQAIGGDEVARALVERLKKAPDAQRVACINVLGAVGGEGAVSTLLEQAKRTDDVGLSALEALGRLGAAQAEPMLWSRIQQGGDRLVVSAYLRVAEHQSPVGALAMYRKLLTLQDDPRTRCAALTGLGRCGGPDAVQDIMPGLTSERDDAFGAAKAALIALNGPDVNNILQNQMGHSEPLVKVALLDVLFRRDAEAGRRSAEQALSDPEVTVRAAAVGLLGETGNLAYEARVQKLAESGSAQVQRAAWHAYALLADSALAGGQSEHALAMYHTLLTKTGDDADQRRALEGLTRLASPETLPYLQQLASNQALQKEAGNCALAIAMEMRATDAATSKRIFRDLLEHSEDVDLASHAAQALRAMGDPVDVARKLGFLTHWQLIGPFPNAGFASVFPPEKEYVPGAQYEGVNGARLKWTDLVIDHVRGVAELDQILKPSENIIVYARSEIEVPKAVDAQIRLGSDDGVQCWVNGQLVHSKDVGRRVKVDNDQVPIKLNGGRNTILLKIVQGGGPCGFCARIVDTRGNPMQVKELSAP